MITADHSGQPMIGPATQRRPHYDAQTLAMDAMAAAGHMVRGFSLEAYDPVRAALAEEHAHLVRGTGGDLQLLAARITKALPETCRRAEARVHAEQQALRDL